MPNGAQGFVGDEPASKAESEGGSVKSFARDARREERRDAILNVAHACFVTDGYGATSMATIAAQLGGSKGTLYNYFKSKEELFGAVVRRSCARLRRKLDATPDEVGMRGRLIGMAEDWLSHLLSPEPMAIHRLVVAEGDRFPELARLFYDAGPRVSSVRQAQLFEQMMGESLLRHDDAARAADDFNSLVLSGVYFLRLWGVIEDPSPTERLRHVERAVDTFLRAYAKDPPPGAARLGSG